ncbi:MAG: hypothetical protein ACTHN3_07075 [Solirubrobacterales bacterium]
MKGTIDGSMKRELEKRQRTDEAIDAIERFVLNAKPVPLTDQVRFDKRKLWPLLEELRQAIAAERPLG